MCTHASPRAHVRQHHELVHQPHAHAIQSTRAHPPTPCARSPPSRAFPQALTRTACPGPTCTFTRPCTRPPSPPASSLALTRTYADVMRMPASADLPALTRTLCSPHAHVRRRCAHVRQSTRPHLPSLARAPSPTCRFAHLCAHPPVTARKLASSDARARPGPTCTVVRRTLTAAHMHVHQSHAHVSHAPLILHATAPPVLARQPAHRTLCWHSLAYCSICIGQGGPDSFAIPGCFVWASRHAGGRVWPA